MQLTPEPSSALLGHLLSADALRYPVVIVAKGMLFPARSATELQQCTSHALKRGFFNGPQLVDSDARGFTVLRAHKVGGVGPFGGFNLFLNRTIRIALETDGTERRLKLGEVQALVLTALRSRQGWDGTADNMRLEREVLEASTPHSVLSAYTRAYFADASA